MTYTKSKPKSITEEQYNILIQMIGESDMYYSFSYFQDLSIKLDRKKVKRIIHELRDMGLVEYRRGLVTEDGDVAGSGYGIPYEKSKEVREVIEAHERKPEQGRQNDKTSEILL